MKLSLHFGLNHVDPSAYGGWDGQLAACHFDAEAMSELAGKRGFDDPMIYLDGDCTRERLLSELKRAAEDCQKGDSFLFTYSGHGGQVMEVGGTSSASPQSETDGLNETLCLFDGEILDDDLHALLAAFRPGVNVAAILDCCHSGGMDRALNERTHRVRRKPRWARTNPKSEILNVKSDSPHAEVNARVVILTACKEDETAADGLDYGAFTESLLKGWKAFNWWRPHTWQSWFEASARACARNHPQQHPCARRLGQGAQLWTERAL